LDANQLSGSIPVEISQMTSLQEIYLHNNLLSGNVPDEIGNKANLKTIYLENNKLESAPYFVSSVLGGQEIEGIRVQNNQFTFASLEPNAANLQFASKYTPQKSLPLQLELMAGNETAPLSLNIETLTGRDLGGDNNRYQWYKEGVVIGSLSSSPEWNIASLAAADTGYYTCRITNTVLTGLTLQTDTLHLVFANEQTDSLALVALYNATNGEGWTNKTNWLIGTMDTWYGVTVDANRRVVTLDLNSNNLVGNLVSELGNLSALQGLYLYNNQLSGSIPAELGNLTYLQDLSLSYNQLSGSIPAELGNLANLKGLYLHNNQLSGSIPPELGNLTNLQELYLSVNQLSGSIPSELGNLTNLQVLRLYNNQLSGSIPVELGNLTNLQTLDLGYNQLSGSIPAELGNLTNLQYLWLDDNQLSGSIPAELGNLTNLQYLYLSSNQLTGIIPAELGNLSNLTHFQIDNNLITEIPVLSSAVLNTNEYDGLRTSNNFLTFASLEPNAANLQFASKYAPQKQLPLAKIDTTILEGSAVNLDIETLVGRDLGGANNLYQWYKNGTAVGSLSASSIYSIASLTPSDTGYYHCDVTNTVLTGLTLNTDSFHLAFPVDYVMQDSLALVALYNATNGPNWTNSSNWLTGTLDTWYGVTLDAVSRVTKLDLINNNLVGTQPTDIGNLTALDTLMLNVNTLSGSIPSSIGNLTKLTYLDLGTNEFNSSLPTDIGNLTQLQTMYIANAKLTGLIPSTIGNLSNLNVLALDRNEFTGSIPAELGNLSSLQRLYLWGNQLTGNIPAELGNLSNLTTLGLNNNQLTGNMPIQLANLSNLQGLYLHYNQLSGNIPASLWDLTGLHYIYLSNNSFTGTLPAEVGNLIDLLEFVIADNQLEGNLPAEIGNCTSLQIFNVSNNQFTGSVPSSITDLQNLQDFNIENNDFQAMPAMASVVLQPTEYSGLQTAGNKFTFASLEPNLAHFGYVRKYSPQQNIALAVPEYIIVPGEVLELNAETITGINLGGANNVYEWFKDGNSLGTGSSSPIYTKANYQVDDAGNYYCQITNSQLSGITIRTENVRVLSGVPPFEEIAGTGIKGLMQGDLVWGDYDSDGDMDFIEVGHDESLHYAIIYRNDNGTFTDINAGLYPAGYSSAAWGDYDNDNDLDLIVLGYDHIIGNHRTTIYKNDAGTFVDINAGLPRAYYGSVEWGDYNNDGRMDILMSGYSDGTRVTKIFQNKTEGFVEVPASLIGVQDGIATWCDIDNDKDLDIFISGFQLNGSNYSALYNNENGNYSEASQSFPGLRYSWVSWADFDNDADYDMLLTGHDETYSKAFLYRNDNGTFVELITPIAGLHHSKHVWADYDNDGDLDVLASGYNNGGYTRLYRNTSGLFTDINAAFTQQYHSSVGFADFDNDNDLDVLLNGYNGAANTYLYRNNLIPNSLPSIPSGLLSVISGSSVSLVWEKATDNETTQEGIKYNIYIENSNGEVIISPMSRLVDGKQLLAAEGRIMGNGFNIDLQGGVYNWTVQAVDGAYAGSNFAPLTNFTVLVPAIQNTQVTNKTALTANISTEILAMGNTTYTTVQAGTVPGDYGNWQEFTSNPLEISGSEFATINIALSGLQPNTVYYYRVKAYNANGTVYSNESNFTTINSVNAVAGIPFYQLGSYNLKANSLVDIDNDGDLDAFTSGYLLHTDIYLNETSPVYTDLSQFYDNGGGGNYGDLADIERTIYPKYTGTKLTVFFTQFNMEAGVDKLYVYDGENSAAAQIPGSPFSGNVVPAKFTATNAAGALTFRMTSDDSNTLEGWHAWIGRDPENRYYARILENTNENFTEKQGTNLPPMTNATTDWADFDLDGDLDLLVAAEYPGIRTTVNVFRNTENVFEEVPNFSLSTSTEGSVEWGDVNNDGYPDVLYSGSWKTEIYINNAGESFSLLQNTNFVGLEYSRVKFVDINKDGYLDFALHGYDGTYVSKIYINDHNSGFTISTDLTLRKMHYGSIDFADYDSDGDQDALVAGHNGSVWLYCVYRNDGNAFNLLAEYSGIDRNAAYWIDFNNDGKQEFVMIGNMDFKLYENSGTSFTEVTNINLPKYQRQNLAFGDYDNDGDLDILFEAYTGSWQTYTELFNIETKTINTPPTQPENLLAETNLVDVNLSWTAATDNSTAQNELTYNIFVRNSAGDFVVSPETNLANGYRFNPKQGNIKNNLAWTFKNLKPDTYTWSVQAIDNSLKGGLFAPEANFTIYGPVTNITFTEATSTSLKISWTNGNGSGRLVAVREGDAGTITNPSNNYPYIANSDWLASKDQLGESGYYVVYMGDQNSVTLTNVSANKTYHIRIFEYVGTNGDESFVFAEGQGNPAVGKTSTSIAILNPSKIDFGVVKAATETSDTKQVILENKGTGDLLWTNASLSNAAYSSTFATSGSLTTLANIAVPISFNYENGPGTYNDTLRIQSNAKGIPYPTEGLVAHYSFNGNANDESGNNNNGTVVGAVMVTNKNSLPNEAYAFDGDDYIEMPNTATLKFSPNNS